MKKLTFFIILFFVLISSYAEIRQYNIYETTKNTRIISFESTNELRFLGSVFISDKIMNTYSEDKILRAFDGDSIRLSSKIKFDYNKWGTKQKLTRQTSYLVMSCDYEGFNIIKPITIEMNNPWKINFHNIMTWILLIIFMISYVIKNKIDGISKTYKDSRKKILLLLCSIYIFNGLLLGYNHISFNHPIIYPYVIISIIIIFLGYSYWRSLYISYIIITSSLGWFMGISIYLESFYSFVITISAISLGLFIGRGYLIISSIPKFFRAIPRHFKS